MQLWKCWGDISAFSNTQDKQPKVWISQICSKAQIGNIFKNSKTSSICPTELIALSLTGLLLTWLMWPGVWRYQLQIWRTGLPLPKRVLLPLGFKHFVCTFYLNFPRFRHFSTFGRISSRSLDPPTPPSFRIGGAEDNFITYIEYCFFYAPMMKSR